MFRDNVRAPGLTKPPPAVSVTTLSYSNRYYATPPTRVLTAASGEHCPLSRIYTSICSIGSRQRRGHLEGNGNDRGAVSTQRYKHPSTDNPSLVTRQFRTIKFLINNWASSGRSRLLRCGVPQFRSSYRCVGPAAGDDIDT